MDPSLIFSLIIFLTLVSVVMGLYWVLAGAGRSRQRLQKRLDNLRGVEGGPPATSLLKPDTFGGLPFLRDRLKKLQVIEPLKLLLIQADVTWPPGVVILLFLLAAMVGLTLGFLKWGVLGGLGGAALGALVPYKFLVSRRKRRVKKFEKQLPDALDLLVRGLKAGYAFTSGLQLAANEMPDPIGTEFRKTFTEFNHGLDLNLALLHLCQRVPLPDLMFFTTAVMIQRETGGNLAEILEKSSTLIRERFKLKGQILALTGEGRMSGLVLVLLPPVLFFILFLVNPEYILLLVEHPTGRMMALTAITLQLLGMMLIRKIVNIKV